MKRSGLVLLFLIIFMLLSSQLIYSAVSPKIKNGVLDLKNWDYDKQGSIILSGEWRMYSERLYHPSNLEGKEPTSFSAPGLWDDYVIFGKKISWLKEMRPGYATYHLNLENVDQSQINALKIGKIANSYKVWINEKLVAQAGRVGGKLDVEIPELKEQVIDLPETKNISIVLQISNFHFREKRCANYIENIKLGTKEQLEPTNLFELISFLIVFLVFIIFFFSYLVRSRPVKLYYFSLFNVLLVIKTGVFSRLFELGLIDKITYWYQLKFELLLSIAIIVVFFKYLRIVAPRLISDIIFKIIFGLGLIISLIVIVSSNQLYNSMFVYGQILLGVLLIYLMYTILKGILKRNINYFVTGVLFVSSIITYDINYFFDNWFWDNLHSIILILLLGYQVFYLIKNDFRSLSEYKKEREQRKTAEDLLETISFIYSSLDNDQIARLASRKLPKLIQYDAVAIMGKEKGYLKELVTRGERNIEDEKIKIKDNELFNDLTNRKSPMIVKDVEDFPWFSKYGKLTNIKSWIGVPLVFEEELIGVLTLGQEKITQYSEVEKSKLAKFSNELAVALKNGYEYSEVEELATKDSLTGLYNRDSFKELSIKEYHQAVRYNHNLSLILIDIDQYQDIIKELDYGVVDKIVEVVANRCKESIRTADYMGRYEGVKLGIILTDTDLFGAKELARRLQEIINEAIVIEGQGEVLVSASLGIAALEEKVGIETLFNLADSALAKAQKEGGDCIKTSKD